MYTLIFPHRYVVRARVKIPGAMRRDARWEEKRRSHRSRRWRQFHARSSVPHAFLFSPRGRFVLQTEISGKFIIYFSCFSLFVYFFSLPPLGSVCRLYFTIIPSVSSLKARLHVRYLCHFCRTISGQLRSNHLCKIEEISAGFFAAIS